MGQNKALTNQGPSYPVLLPETRVLNFERTYVKT